MIYIQYKYAAIHTVLPFTIYKCNRVCVKNNHTPFFGHCCANHLISLFQYEILLYGFLQNPIFMNSLKKTSGLSTMTGVWLFFDGDSKTAAAPRTAATLADRLFCTVVILMAPIRREWLVGIFSCQMISDGWMNLSWRRRLESEPDGSKKKWND